MTSFGQRVEDCIRDHGNLCVGIDPHAGLLDAWGLERSAAGLREFGLRVVDAAAGRAGAVKAQVAFFEAHGSAGFSALEEVLAAARAAGLLVIADAKRGDIGSTMDGYTAAWLTPGSPLEADAVTLSPYLGPDSLRTALTTAIREGKGAFVLAATSNPEAFTLQSARTVDVGSTDEQTVADRVARDVGWANSSAAFAGSLGPIGLVVGATVDRVAVGLSDAALRRAPILAPGFGAQGARPEDLRSIFGEFSGQVLANESRSLLMAGPSGLADAIGSRASEYRDSRG